MQGPLPEAKARTGPPELRVSTITPASVRLLQQAEVWSSIQPPHSAAFGNMQVQLQAYFVQKRFAISAAKPCVVVYACVLRVCTHVCMVLCEQACVHMLVCKQEQRNILVQYTLRQHSDVQLEVLLLSQWALGTGVGLGWQWVYSLQCL